MRHVRRAILFAWVFYWVGIFTLTHLPRLRPPAGVSDKTGHLLAFFVWGLLGGLVIRHQSGRWDRIWWLLPLGLVYAALDEWTQPLVGRSCELADWRMDVAGIMAALAVLSLARLMSGRGKPTVEPRPART